MIGRLDVGALVPLRVGTVGCFPRIIERGEPGMIAPGSFGAFAGLRTDDLAHVLNARGLPIPRLYAAGATGQDEEGQA